MGKWRPDPVPVPPRAPYKKPPLPQPARRPLSNSAREEPPGPKTAPLTPFELLQLSKAVAAYRSGSPADVSAAKLSLELWPVVRLFSAAHTALVYYSAAARLFNSVSSNGEGSSATSVERLSAVLPAGTAVGRERVEAVFTLMSAVNEGVPFEKLVARPFDACCDMLAVCACLLASSSTVLPPLSAVLSGAEMPDPDVVV